MNQVPPPKPPKPGMIYISGWCCHCFIIFVNESYAVFHWQIFATNRQKSVNSIGPLKNPPMELTDFERFVAKICQCKTALFICKCFKFYYLYRASESC